MLERIGLHQTRLRTPGLSLDGKGIALGNRGLVLFPTLDRLVAFLSVYTREKSLEDLVSNLTIHGVHSELGATELALEVSAESSDRMDRICETARLVGGHTFTGTSRHFVQYRDASAPFGFDVTELVVSDAPLLVYHNEFTQAYAKGKSVDLRSLLLRLELHVDPSTRDAAGPRWIVAEPGLGPALVHYFVRSNVEGEVCLVEWPPESAFDTSPIRRFVFRLPDLPVRMRPLIRKTPGLTSFVPAGPGIAVELGYRHAVALRACPIFDPIGLTLLRGARGKAPWTLPHVPAMGEIRSFARVNLASEEAGREIPGLPRGLPDALRLPLRLVPTPSPPRSITATILTHRELPLLRSLAYSLPAQTIRTTRVAWTDRALVLLCERGIDSVPLGTFYVNVIPGMYIPSGYALVPSVAPEVLRQALGIRSGLCFFMEPSGRVLAVDDRAFAPLETLLIEAIPWEPETHRNLELALSSEAIAYSLSDLPLLPMNGAAGVDPNHD